jgi:hypothetical protein
MDDAPENLTLNNLQHHKKFLYIGAVVFVLFLAVATAFLLRSQSTSPNVDDSKNVDIQPSQNYIFRNPAVVSNNNPLISDKDLEKAKEKFDSDLKKFNLPTPTPHVAEYNYKLSPQLKGGAPSSFLPFFAKPALAAGCTQITAPATVDVHKLKTHISKELALSIAKELGVESYEAYATPSTDGGFSYFLVNPKEPGSYVILSESNGNFLYHHAITETGSPIEKAFAESKATSLAKSYSFLKGLTFIETLEHTQNLNNAFSTRLYKDWGVYNVVNRTSIDKLTDTESVCDIQTSQDTNVIQMDLAIDGITTNATSKVKLIDSTVKLPSISLEKALAENPESIIAPYAFDDNPDLINNVTIEESVLAYIDIGMDMAQCAYAPTYITSGKTQTGKRVVAVFPAVSAKDLEALCAGPEKKESLNIKEGEGTHSTVQYKTYTVPTPTLPPYPTGGYGKCFGYQIDYLVDCRDALNNTCNVFLGVPYKEEGDDAFNVCKDGPRAPEEFAYSKATGSDVCKQVFLDVNSRLASQNKKQIPLDNYLPPQTLMPSGNVTCHFSVNPC